MIRAIEEPPTQITYIFGAGASANALPVVKDMHSRMIQIRELISHNKFRLSGLDNFTYNQQKLPYDQEQYQKKLIQDFDWMIDNSRPEKHSSVDTFAKKLYLRNDVKDLRKLKFALSVFMILEQMKNGVDIRYDSLLASILQEHISDFPNHIRIISWNYDNQFELAFNDYSMSNDIISNMRSVNLVTKYQYLKENEIKDRFSIFKVNGTAGFMNKKQNFPTLNLLADPTKKEIDISIIRDIVERYAWFVSTDDFFSSLSFAWENYESEDRDVIKSAEDNTYRTTILVVIGYSFPFFNRGVDRKLINSMSVLKKVYIQDFNPETVKDSFLAIRNLPEHQFELRTLKSGKEQFLIPPEL